MIGAGRGGRVVVVVVVVVEQYEVVVRCVNSLPYGPSMQCCMYGEGIVIVVVGAVVVVVVGW